MKPRKEHKEEIFFSFVLLVSFVVPSFNFPKEGVAKSIKALNHEGHEGHKGKEKLFFVLLVSFVVPFFSEPFVTPLKQGAGASCLP